MKRINIAGTSIVTGTALADAVLDFWTSIAKLHRLETAEIPFVDDDGTRQTAQLVLCAAVPLWTSTMDYEGAELTDAGTLSEITSRNATLDPLWGLAPVENDGD
jgi:hypothetical protein